MDRLDYLLGQINKASYECNLEDKILVSVEDLILLKSEIQKLQKQVTGKNEKIKDLQVKLNNLVSKQIKTYKDINNI